MPGCAERSLHAQWLGLRVPAGTDSDGWSLIAEDIDTAVSVLHAVVALQVADPAVPVEISDGDVVIVEPSEEFDVVCELEGVVAERFPVPLVGLGCRALPAGLGTGWLACAGCWWVRELLSALRCALEAKNRQMVLGVAGWCLPPCDPLCEAPRFQPVPRCERSQLVTACCDRITAGQRHISACFCRLVTASQVMQ